jgi:type VI protein secretion system component VasF
MFGVMSGNKYDVEKTSIIFNPAENKFAFSENASSTPYLIERIDHRIRELKEGSQSIYCQSIDNWIVAEAEQKIEEKIPEWVKSAIFVFSAVLLFLGLRLVKIITKDQLRGTPEVTDERRGNL